MEDLVSSQMQPRADLREDFAWIREETLTGLLVSVGGLLWLWILLYLRSPFDVWPGWGTLLGVLTLVVISLGETSVTMEVKVFIGAPVMLSVRS